MTKNTRVVVIALLVCLVFHVAKSCVDDVLVGPFYTYAGLSEKYYLSDVRNITSFKATGYDEITGEASNFEVTLEDKFGIFFRKESIDGCVGLDKNYTNLVSLITMTFYCKNALLGCYISFDVDYDLCFGVCVGEFCQYDGCGNLCELCQYPCNGDYCLSEPIPSFSMSQSDFFEEENTPAISPSPLQQPQDTDETKAKLTASEKAGVAFGVLMSVAGLACIIMFYRSPDMMKRIIGRK